VLVLDGVGVVQKCFFKEFLKVVHRRSRLALAVACGLCGMPCARAASFLVDATTINHGHLEVLFAPFHAGLGILLDTLDCGADDCYHFLAIE
jgi:hypothetical protein